MENLIVGVRQSVQDCVVLLLLVLQKQWLTSGGGYITDELLKEYE